MKSTYCVATNWRLNFNIHLLNLVHADHSQKVSYSPMFPRAYSSMEPGISTSIIIIKFVVKQGLI